MPSHCSPSRPGKIPRYPGGNESIIAIEYEPFAGRPSESRKVRAWRAAAALVSLQDHDSGKWQHIPTLVIKQMWVARLT